MILSVLCCWWLNPCLPQGTATLKRKDSLNQVLKVAKEDTNKVKALLLYGRIYQTNNFDSATYYFKAAEVLSRKLDFAVGLFNALTNQANPLVYQNRFDEAIAVNTQALQVAIKANRPNLISAAYLNMGRPYSSKGDFGKAVEYTLKAMKIADEQKDSVRLTNIFINLGYFYQNLNDHVLAYEYDLKGVYCARRVQNRANLQMALLNLSEPLTKFKKYDTAIIVLKEAAAIAEDLNDKINGPIIISNLIVDYRMLGQNEKTLPLIRQLIEKATASKATEGLILAYDNMGDYHMYNRSFDSATKYYLRAVEIMTETGINKYLEVTYKGLMDAKAGAHEFEAYEHFRDLRDSVRTAAHAEDVLKVTKELELKYDTEKKEQQLKLQSAEISQQRMWKYILGGLLLLLAVIALLAVRGYRNRQQLLLNEQALQRQQIIQLENEKQLTATQAVLKGQEEERSRLAKDLHDGLGGILSSAKYSFSNMKQNFILSEDNAMAFEKSMNMLDQSITELRRVAHNMMPETLMKLTLNEALQDYCLQITQSGALKVTYQSVGMEQLVVDNTIKTTVYRIVQELTNNIIKHAHATGAMVQVIAKEHLLNITVEDDGKGFDTAMLQDAGGIGYKNTLSRVSFLKGTMDTRSKKGEGTSVYIEIPLQS